MRNKILLAILAAIIIIIPQKALAQEKASKSSASILLPEIKQTGFDYRVKVLSSFLRKENSPLEDSASDFVNFADTYNLDWRLVAAISGTESSFGKHIPFNSYNGWGWGVYGDNVIRFSSWKEGIKTVSEGLREKYIDKWGSENIYQIGKIYASSPHWAGHVEYFLNRISDFELKNPRDSLLLSL